MPSPEQLLDGFAFLRNRVRDEILRSVSAQWSAFGETPPTAADIDLFVERVVPLVQGGQLTVASATDSYLANLMGAITGDAVSPVGLTPDVVTDLRPKPPEEVYRRPFVNVWTALANGASPVDALRAGADRLARLADDDLSLAHRNAAMTVLDSDDRVRGYRRVIRPEMSREGSCGICIAASDMRYKRGNLMPVHTYCNCAVMPIVARAGGRVSDPGRRFNDTDIEQLYINATRTAGSTRAADLKKVRVSVHEHGELGPTLKKRGETFTGPGDISVAA